MTIIRYIPVVVQNLAFLAARKSPRIKDRKWVNISNMNPFAIFDPRGFGALEMPIFESRPVYALLVRKFIKICFMLLIEKI